MFIFAKWRASVSSRWQKVFTKSIRNSYIKESVHLVSFFYIIASFQKGTSRLIEDPYIRIYSWPNTFVSFSDIIPVKHLKAELKVCWVYTSTFIHEPFLTDKLMTVLCHKLLQLLHEQSISAREMQKPNYLVQFQLKCINSHGN